MIISPFLEVPTFEELPCLKDGGPPVLSQFGEEVDVCDQASEKSEGT